MSQEIPHYDNIMLLYMVFPEYPNICMWTAADTPLIRPIFFRSSIMELAMDLKKFND